MLKITSSYNVTKLTETSWKEYGRLESVANRLACPMHDLLTSQPIFPPHVSYQLSRNLHMLAMEMYEALHIRIHHSLKLCNQPLFPPFCSKTWTCRYQPHLAVGKTDLSLAPCLLAIKLFSKAGAIALASMCIRHQALCSGIKSFAP